MAFNSDALRKTLLEGLMGVSPRQQARDERIAEKLKAYEEMRLEKAKQDQMWERERIEMQRQQFELMRQIEMQLMPWNVGASREEEAKRAYAKMRNVGIVGSQGGPLGAYIGSVPDAGGPLPPGTDIMYDAKLDTWIGRCSDGRVFFGTSPAAARDQIIREEARTAREKSPEPAAPEKSPEELMEEALDKAVRAARGAT